MAINMPEEAVRCEAKTILRNSLKLQGMILLRQDGAQPDRAHSPLRK
jgi:hypothetical protein